MRSKTSKSGGMQRINYSNLFSSSRNKRDDSCCYSLESAEVMQSQKDSFY